MVGRLLSYWEGNFSGAMLNFQGVTINVESLWIHIPELVKENVHVQGISLHHHGFMLGVKGHSNLSNLYHTAMTMDENKKSYTAKKYGNP